VKLSTTLALLGAAAALSCTTQVAAQSQSVDCATAKEDIAHLEHEKKSTDERKMKGVMSILPIGIAINAVSSATSSNDEMDIDEYNKKLESRIAEIKAACKM